MDKWVYNSVHSYPSALNGSESSYSLPGRYTPGKHPSTLAGIRTPVCSTPSTSRFNAFTSSTLNGSESSDSLPGRYTPGKHPSTLDGIRTPVCSIPSTSLFHAFIPSALNGSESSDLLPGRYTPGKHPSTPAAIRTPNVPSRLPVAFTHSYNNNYYY